MITNVKERGILFTDLRISSTRRRPWASSTQSETGWLVLGWRRGLADSYPNGIRYGYYPGPEDRHKTNPTRQRGSPSLTLRVGEHGAESTTVGRARLRPGRAERRGRSLPLPIGCLDIAAIN